MATERIGHGIDMWHCRCHPGQPGFAVPSMAADCEDRTDNTSPNLTKE